jgi:type VI protein secretion system component Hcp
MQTENISFNFKDVEVDYTEQNERGKEGKKSHFGWKIDANVRK